MRGDGPASNLRDGQHFLVSQLQSIDALLEVDVVGRKLGLCDESDMSLRILLLGM
jgi:hypothetical protein